MKYKIGEFSKLVNVPVKTLRYYDEISLFKPKEVDIFSNYRYYLESQIDDLNIILELKEAGFMLEEIKKYWNNWDDKILLQQKEKIYLEKEEINKKIKKLDELRTRMKDGVIYNKETDIVSVKERKRL
ncbi:MAG: MerR family transcriptional regulator [Bacilli bacterium]|nr:MerR family transcriptional regulator [Bacilli bacterium]